MKGLPSAAGSFATSGTNGARCGAGMILAATFAAHQLSARARVGAVAVVIEVRTPTTLIAVARVE
jgi:hypothetical protein